MTEHAARRLGDLHPLLERLLQDDAAAWDELVAGFSGFLYGVAARTFSLYGFPATDQDREDAVAEVWRNLLEHDKRLIRKCLADDSFTPTLHVLARNRSIDIMRRHRGPTVDFLAESIPAPDTVGKPDHLKQLEAVKEELKRLRPRERTLVTLFFLQGRRYREIARLTGIPINSIGPTLARAVERLRARLHDADI